MFYHRCGFSLEQNRLTAAQSIRGVLATFNIGVDQTQKTGLLHSSGLVRASHYDGVRTWLQTSISSLSAALVVLLSSFRCLHSEGSLGYIFSQSPRVFLDGGECAFPGTIFNRAPPGEAGEWLSQQLH